MRGATRRVPRAPAPSRKPVPWRPWVPFHASRPSVLSFLHGCSCKGASRTVGCNWQAPCRRKPEKATVSSLTGCMILQDEFRVEPGKHHQLSSVLGAGTAGRLGDPLWEGEKRARCINKSF